MADLSGKRIAVLGVANEDSIAWHIARKFKAEGAAVYISYQMRFKSRVMQLLNGADVRPDGVFKCDVTVPADVDEFFQQIGPVDAVIHSLAFAPMETFGRPVHDLSPAEFAQTLETSAYSLLSVTRSALPHLAPSASVIAMSYLGAQRVVPGYRVMGIAKAALEACVRELAVEVGPRGVRVNAISAGPIRTLAAQAVPDFDRLLSRYAEITPLRTTIDAADVADLAGFLASASSRKITGQVLFVDGGYSILGAMK
jgi:enoyl-[acyl-carrier protein] reductase I